MHGPTAATTRAGSAPSRAMAASVASRMPRDRAAPAGMCGPDHPGHAIGKQHRRTVGGDDAQHDTGPVGHHRIGMRSGAGRPRRLNRHRIGPMHLEQPNQRRHARRRARAATRARFSITAARSSRPDRLQLRLANGPSETPPRRVKKPCRTPSQAAVSGSGASVSSVMETSKEGQGSALDPPRAERPLEPNSERPCINRRIRAGWGDQGGKAPGL